MTNAKLTLKAIETQVCKAKASDREDLVWSLLREMSPNGNDAFLAKFAAGILARVAHLDW